MASVREGCRARSHRVRNAEISGWYKDGTPCSPSVTPGPSKPLLRRFFAKSGMFDQTGRGGPSYAVCKYGLPPGSARRSLPDRRVRSDRYLRRLTAVCVSSEAELGVTTDEPPSRM